MYKILVVEERHTILSAVTEYLSMHDYDVYSSKSCSNALIKIPRIEPDLIAVSSNLEDMSGFDFCKIIKNDPDYRDILVLMVIAADSPIEENKAVYAGCDDFIAENFRGNLLLSKLRSLFRIKDLNNTLKNRYAELEEANKYLELQFRMATKVQRSIIKDIDMSFRDIKVITKYLPALAIGGDFFNVQILDNNRLGIIIGDVSGHGVPSSLLTIMLSQIFVSVCHAIDKPSALLRRMNEAFYSIFEGSDNDMYACVFYAIIDTRTNTITYSNAGETYPIIVDRTGAKADELELDGIPVGMIKQVNYTDKSLVYDEGDILFFHTDGLGDFYYKDNNDLFMEKLGAALMENVKMQEKIEDILEKTLGLFYEEKDRHRYKTDDVSVIICRL